MQSLLLLLLPLLLLPGGHAGVLHHPQPCAS
jgi:hypothetical protein